MDNKIATTISIARKTQKYTLKDLSKITNLSISYICEIEHARKTPSLKTIKKLFKALNINLDNISMIFDEDTTNN